MNRVETFEANRWKHIYWHILALFEAKDCSKIWPIFDIFHMHLKVLTIRLHTKFYGLVLDTFRENGQKPPKFHICYLFIIKGPLKKIIEEKNQNSSSTTSWAMLCKSRPNIGKIGLKLRESLFDLKKGLTGGRTDGRRTAQHRINSTDYLRNGANKGVFNTTHYLNPFRLILSDPYKTPSLPLKCKHGYLNSTWQ